LKLLYDKNGCGSPNIYCWKCSGKEDDNVKVLRSGETRVLKGCMTPQIQTHVNVHYKCVDCDYETNYHSDYIKAWKI